MIIDPPDKSSALTLFQEGQLETCAEQKTVEHIDALGFCGRRLNVFVATQSAGAFGSTIPDPATPS